MSIKAIRNKNDLAINGAPPAFNEPLHVGRPNIGDRKLFLEKINQILDSRWLTNNGPIVQEFENRIAEHLEVKHCVAMCNGTIALEIAIRALGLEGEVIVPSWTFIATAHSLFWQDIMPIFADIDPLTHNLDPAAVRRMITPRTSGIIGVHLWGRAAPINELEVIANEHGLKLMFDAAHAFGSTYKGETIGRFGSCEVLSFHATKFFNTFEGGAVVTNNDELAETMRLMRNFGFQGYDNVIHPGTNGKMIEMCAAMGLTNLECIDKVIEANRSNYYSYCELLSKSNNFSILQYDENERNNFQYIVIELADNCKTSRDDIIHILHAENILARKYFWPGCHKMEPYNSLSPHAGMLLKNTEVVADRIIVLPTGHAIGKEEILIIARTLEVSSI